MKNQIETGFCDLQYSGSHFHNNIDYQTTLSSNQLPFFVCHDIHPNNTLNNGVSCFFCYSVKCHHAECRGTMLWNYSLYCNKLLCFVCLRPIAATTFIQTTYSKMVFHIFCYSVKCHHDECHGTIWQCYSTLCYKHFLFCVRLRSIHPNHTQHNGFYYSLKCHCAKCHGAVWWCCSFCCSWQLKTRERQTWPASLSWCQCYQTFFSSSETLLKNKLVGLSLESFSVWL